jgi:hypothetical protein
MKIIFKIIYFFICVVHYYIIIPLRIKKNFTRTFENNDYSDGGNGSKSGFL